MHTTGSTKRRFNRPTDTRLPPKTPQTSQHLLPLILIITSLPLILPHLLRPTTTMTRSQQMLCHPTLSSPTNLARMAS
ncbi:hypothetical protein ID866_12082 [Astraeus odoratus]|nr:hypothetical protein ID866_12082 [Astraeus odoratus]